MKIKYFLALSLFSTASFSMLQQQNSSFAEETPGKYTNFHGNIVSNQLSLYDSNTWISGKGNPVNLDSAVNQTDFCGKHSAEEVSKSLAACLSMNFQLDATASGNTLGNFDTNPDDTNSDDANSDDTNSDDTNPKSCDYSQVLNEWKKNPMMILSISDPHCTGHTENDYKPEKYIQYANAVEKLIADYTGVVFLAICGDAAPRKAGKKGSVLNFANSDLFNFINKLSEIIKAKNKGSQLIYILGNHDVQSKDQFNNFIKKAKEQNINILVNLPSLWKDGYSDYLNTVAYSNGSVVVVPYCMNLPFGGGSLAQAMPESDMSEICCGDLFRDCQREGIPDIVFGCPIKQSKATDVSNLSLNENNDEKTEGFALRVAALGDRSGFNSAAEQTADIFFSSILRAAQNQQNTPITAIVAAHDYYLRPAIFYEIMSRFIRKYRLPPNILQRLRIIIAGAHEHSKYAGAGNCYLMGTDKKIYQIPCSFGGAGMYLSAINVFSVPQCALTGGKYVKWIQPPDYERYAAWVEKWKEDHENFMQDGGFAMGRPKSFNGTGYDGKKPGQDYTLKANFTDKNFQFTVPEYAKLPQIVETEDGQLIMQTVESDDDVHDGNPIFELADGRRLNQVHRQPVAKSQQPSVPAAAPQPAQPNNAAPNVAVQNGNFVTRHPWITAAATTAICVALGTFAYRRWVRK